MLPAPGELVRLALPCPPQLVELSGYDGGARLVAMWWSPLGDEPMICDGTLTMTGCWRGRLCFCGHPLVRVFLDPYRLGDSENEGEHRLLADRHLATVHASVTVSYRELAEVIALAPGALAHRGRPSGTARRARAAARGSDGAI